MSERVTEGVASATTLARRTLVEQVHLCAGLLGLMVALAGIEALTVSLVAPLLSAQSGQPAFGSTPFLGRLEAMFAQDTLSAQVAFIALALGTVLLIRALTQAATVRLQSVLGARMSASLSRRTVGAFLDASFAFATAGKSTDHVFAFQQYSEQTSQMVLAFTRLVGSAIVLMAYLGLMLLLSVPITLLAGFSLGVVFLLLRRALSERLARTTAEFNVRARDRNAYAMQSVQGTRLVRLLAAETEVAERIRERVERVLKVRVRRELLSALFSIVTPAIAGGFVCIVLISAARVNVDSTGDWLSPMILFVVVMFRLLSPLSDAVNAFGQITATRPSAQALAEYLDSAARHPQVSGYIEPASQPALIEFRDASFAYSDDGVPAVDGVSFELRRGDRVGLVGPSGGGKSTVVNLLAGFFTPRRGRVLVDGEDLQALDMTAWRRRLSVVDQDPFFFNATVRENLALASPQADDDAMWGCLRDAGAEEFVKATPGGLDASVGERGVQLSGGQRQRLALARALLQGARVLVLDEATSQLDSFAQNFVQSTLDALPEDVTIVVIAHRLSTVTALDRVLVLDAGRVVDSGPPSELAQRAGLFREMLAHQGIG